MMLMTMPIPAMLNSTPAIAQERLRRASSTTLRRSTFWPSEARGPVWAICGAVMPRLDDTAGVQDRGQGPCRPGTLAGSTTATRGAGRCSGLVCGAKSPALLFVMVVGASSDSEREPSRVSGQNAPEMLPLQLPVSERAVIDALPRAIIVTTADG